MLSSPRRSSLGVAWVWTTSLWIPKACGAGADGGRAGKVGRGALSSCRELKGGGRWLFLGGNQGVSDGPFPVTTWVRVSVCQKEDWWLPQQAKGYRSRVGYALVATRTRGPGCSRGHLASVAFVSGIEPPCGLGSYTSAWLLHAGRKACRCLASARTPRRQSESTRTLGSMGVVTLRWAASHGALEGVERWSLLLSCTARCYGGTRHTRSGDSDGFTIRRADEATVAGRRLRWPGCIASVGEGIVGCVQGTLWSTLDLAPACRRCCATPRFP